MSTTNMTNDEEEEWNTLQSQMTHLLTTQQSQQSTLQNLTSRLATSTTTLAQHSTHLQQESTRIQSKLQHSINIETAALNNENDELSTHLQTVQQLTTQRDDLTSSNTTIAQSISKTQSNIQSYTHEQAQHLSAIQDIETTHTNRLPKIKREMTLHAAITNVKWDYSAPKDVLRGEVSYVDQCVVDKFEVEREGDVVGVADCLWEIVEG